ncbi:MAG: ribonuclease / adenosylcobalamin/alpha-ribazole phosphatase [Frankiales bacterium]|nr:ribonuclease / adenosylcobalamin/alpha-ribazole phosphatase [Frankiales bacterium]
MSRRLIVEADGGARGNPGPAGYGTVVRDAESGEVLHEEGRALGRQTSNVAEYRGLIAGLRAAAAIDPDADVEARLDSKLLVEQMSGNWKVKNEGLRPLASEAAQLVRGLGNVRFTWVPREQNTAADALANQAMDDAAAGNEWSLREPEPEPAASLVDRSAVGDAERAVASNRLPGWMAAPAPATTTLLLRHGETPLSLNKRFSGRGDVELTPRGVAQAAAAAHRIATRGGVDVIVTSPLTRARMTAQAAADALHDKVVVDNDFAETDFGEWEGFTFAEVHEKWPEQLAAWLADPSVLPPGGESFAETTARVRRGVERLVESYAGKTVLVVSHVTPIKVLTQLSVEAPSTALYRLHLDLASLTEIDWYADGPAVLRRFNDTAHLEGTGA